MSFDNVFLPSFLLAQELKRRVEIYWYWNSTNLCFRDYFYVLMQIELETACTRQQAEENSGAL